MKAVVFGATESARSLYREIKMKYEIVAYCDNDKNKWGKQIDDIIILSPEEIFKLQWDEVIIISLSSMNVIKRQLLNMGVEEKRINISYVDLGIQARKTFLQDYAKLVYKNNIFGAVAEAGVFQGEFAKVINESFFDRKLYLFDTFEGFDAKDIAYEEQNGYSSAKAGYLNITTEELVMKKMKYPENCIIRKGYFPDSAEGIAEKFCFVNLDMDLYKPTLEGLRFFYPRMNPGGIIVVHDYFTEGYEGVNAALEEFQKECRIYPFPIGDSISVAIQKGE